MRTKFIALLVIVFLTSCGAESPSRTQSQENQVGKTSAETAPAPSRDSSGAEDKKVAEVTIDQADKSKAPPVQVSRKIIRNANLVLEVSSPEEVQQTITTIAESKGGFVVESQQSSSSSNINTRDIVTMTVRIPAERFNESLDEIRRTSGRVISETVKGQDVTEEFVDIDARLKAKKALEAQFIEIMKQGKTVQDALQVQRELANVRGEIEQIEGRLRFLENQTSLSTISVKLQTPTAYVSNPKGFVYQLGESISTGFNYALNFILGLVTVLIAILPFVLFIILPILLILRYFWRRIRTRKAAIEILAQESKEEMDA